MSDDQTHSSERKHMPFWVTQILGFCFYWAWVYLSFNSTSSINASLTSTYTMLWVHVASSGVGAAAYVLVVLFAPAVERWCFRRDVLVGAGFALAAATALYAFPLPIIPEWVVYGAAATSGVTSAIVLVNWGALYASLSARSIVLSTAGAFLAANIIYFVSLFLPSWGAFALLVAMPLCAAFLIPNRDALIPYLGPHQTNINSEPLRVLPWRVALGLFVVMFVYGGVRVFVGVSDAEPGSGLVPTVLITIGVLGCFFIWGAIFQGEYASLGAAYKIMLPLLACALLMMALFGQEYVVAMAVLATVSNIVIEVLSWILLADVARTTRTPVLVVFALGRGAVQAGMMCGQIIGWVLVDQVVPFAIVGVFALMLVMGFMFDNQNTLLVFEVPSVAEQALVEEKSGLALTDRIEQVAQEQGLTQRETEILMLWATGHGSKYIQETLVISASTVKTHVRHIYDKCGVHNRADLIDLLEQRSLS